MIHLGFSNDIRFPLMKSSTILLCLIRLSIPGVVKIRSVISKNGATLAAKILASYIAPSIDTVSLEMLPSISSIKKSRKVNNENIIMKIKKTPPNIIENGRNRILSFL